ncbi:hypothetical protein HK405_000272, partial [Cladochytrium tenue]
KVMLLGDSGVGKTQLFTRLTNKEFQDDPRPTEGINFATHSVKIASGLLVKAQVMDTPGDDRTRPIVQVYWPIATGAVVVYDVTNRHSFQSVRRWVRDFRARHRLEPTIMVVGNKCEPDAEPLREVSVAEAKAYALAQGFFFMEVSARDDVNVDLAFNILLTE